MDAGKEIQKAIRAISTKDASAAATYHALSDDARKKVIEALSANSLKSLTRLIKDAGKKSFEAASKRFLRIAAGIIATPVYLLDETLIEENMRIMRYVKDRTGCKVLHALKSYASFATFPMMSRYLDGTCASGLHEARLGYEEFRKEVHTFGAAYPEKEIKQIIKYSDSIIFNSFYQLRKYAEMARKSGVETGLRVNPGHAEVATDMYNPCAPCSRLGIIYEIFNEEFPKYKHIVDGLHFHAMCEQNSDVLERILKSFEKLYGQYIKGLKWVNFRGGHHITRDDYDLELLIKLINAFKKKYGVQVYLEPGEASVLNAGVLISSVLDIAENEMKIAIIDASAET
ncbi:MAG: hypothetical protein V1764_04010, partial [Nitrospirota bacterium]